MGAFRGKLPSLSNFAKHHTKNGVFAHFATKAAFLTVFDNFRAFSNIVVNFAQNHTKTAFLTLFANFGKMEMLTKN